MSKTLRILFIVLAVVGILAYLIVPKIFSGKEKQGEGRSSPQDQVTPVDVFVVKPGDIQNELLTVGTITPNEEVEVRSELPRKITGIHFKEGSFVPAGKLMFTLDNSDLLAQLRKLEIEEELMSKQAEREMQLLEKGLFTQDEYDIRLTNIEKIRADKEIVLISLDKTEITAPFSGIAGFRNVSKGSFVNNTVVLTTIKDIGRLKVDFSIPEKYIPQFSKGQQISFSVEGFDDEFTGTVTSFDPQLNENTRSLILRAIAANPGGKLLPGSFVKVKLKLERIPDAVMVPTESVIPQQEGNSIFVIQNSEAVSKKIEVGTRTEKEIMVIQGLSEGDSIITTNILRLRNKSKVRPVNVY